MTEISLQFSLPDGLARDARAAGLLAPDALQRLLEQELRRDALRRIADGAQRVTGAGEPPLSLADIQREVDAVRRGA